MKQFIFTMRRHGLPMIASAASASVLTWMMCDLEYSKCRKSSLSVQPAPPPPLVEKKPKTEHEWHGN